MTSRARALLVRAILFALGALPFISWSLSGTAATRFLDGWFRFQCHGRLDRSLSLADRFFPVCSRCLGIYAGLSIAALVALPGLSPRLRRVWLLGAAALMVLEVAIQDLTQHAPVHALRLLTGLLVAYPVGLILIDAAQATDHRRAASQAAR